MRPITQEKWTEVDRYLTDLVVPADPALQDLVFIDADKSEYPEYFAWSLALALTRRGSLIVGDNVVREGAVVEGANPDPRVQGARRFHEKVGAEARVSATAIQTVGSKGYDGFTLALVVADGE
jgi:predicted O-methyltransferase YrrM